MGSTSPCSALLPSFFLAVSFSSASLQAQFPSVFARRYQNFVESPPPCQRARRRRVEAAPPASELAVAGTTWRPHPCRRVLSRTASCPHERSAAPRRRTSFRPSRSALPLIRASPPLWCSSSLPVHLHKGAPVSVMNATTCEVVNDTSIFAVEASSCTAAFLPEDMYHDFFSELSA